MSTLLSSNVLAALTRCFASGDFADLTIKCGHRSWKGHRVIVCSQSPVLDAALEGHFKEATSKEIDLEDDSPATVNLMLTFLYTADYNHDPEISEVPPLQLHAQVYSLADKYQIPTLMHCAIEKYKCALKAKPDLEEYLLSVPEVYVAPASGNELRAIAVKFARRFLREGIEHGGVRLCLREVIDQVPEYGFDILESFFESTVRGDCHTCGPDQEADALQARCRKCGRGGIHATY